MAASTNKLRHIVQGTQGQLLEYLKCADERQERQSHATVKALPEIQQGQKAIAQIVANNTETLAMMLPEAQALTAKTLELTRDIHTRTTSGSSSSH